CTTLATRLCLLVFFLIFCSSVFTITRYCVLCAIIPFSGPASSSIACTSSMSRCYVLCAIIRVYKPSIYVLCAFILIYGPLIFSMCLHLVLCTVLTILCAITRIYGPSP